ncbi:MAG: hypothetical protein DWC08_04050 [Candidatus Poseidoniales archaeon]|nr:MAG: hypothetical protein DWC08_04050 [Candidatus Poseidoniales archaeon]
MVNWNNIDEHSYDFSSGYRIALFERLTSSIRD